MARTRDLRFRNPEEGSEKSLPEHELQDPSIPHAEQHAEEAGNGYLTMTTELTEDILAILEAWPKLPAHIKEAIRVLVRGGK